MKLHSVFYPNDQMFTQALHRVTAFCHETPHCNIPASFFAATISRMYLERSSLLLLLLILDDDGRAHGHFLGLVENSFGRLLGWCYQLKMDNDIPFSERLKLIRDGKDLVMEWAKANHCTALAMATRRNLPAMARRFGFHPTHTLMECPL